MRIVGVVAELTGCQTPSSSIAKVRITKVVDGNVNAIGNYAVLAVISARTIVPLKNRPTFTVTAVCVVVARSPIRLTKQNLTTVPENSEIV